MLFVVNSVKLHLTRSNISIEKTGRDLNLLLA